MTYIIERGYDPRTRSYDMDAEDLSRRCDVCPEYLDSAEVHNEDVHYCSEACAIANEDADRPEMIQEYGLPQVEMTRDTHGHWYWQATLPREMAVPAAGTEMWVRLADNRILPRTRDRVVRVRVTRTSFPGPARMTAWHSRYGGVCCGVAPVEMREGVA